MKCVDLHRWDVVDLRTISKVSAECFTRARQKDALSFRTAWKCRVYALRLLRPIARPPQSLFSNFHSEKNIEDCVEKQWEDLVSADLPKKNAVQKNVVFPTRVLHVQSSGAHVQKRGVLFGMT